MGDNAKQLEIAARLVAAISSDIRIKFGVLEGMTPDKVVRMAQRVESELLDRLSYVLDVRTICDEDGFLKRD